MHTAEHFLPVHVFRLRQVVRAGPREVVWSAEFFSLRPLRMLSRRDSSAGKVTWSKQLTVPVELASSKLVSECQCLVDAQTAVYHLFDG